MLKLRVITAVVLLAVLLPLLFNARSEPFVLAAWVIVSAGAWEWGKMNGLSPISALAAAVTWALVVAAIWWPLGWTGGVTLWTLTTLVWMVASVIFLRTGVASWTRVPGSLRLLGGWVLLALAWLALKQAREIGVNFLLSCMSLVWMADICAYFGGRAWGKRKLAPSISPGKSWAGVYSGAIGVLVLSQTWMWFERLWPMDSVSLYASLHASHPVGAWFALLMLTGMSVVGDLLESQVKRSAGFKDSSQLLPGHGGVLDRLDALLPVLPLALFLTSL
jgi:phosphatidate cytidylyltransferase